MLPPDVGPAFNAIGKSMMEFAADAASGAIAVSPTGGEALLKAIKELAKWVDGNLGDLNEFGQQPQLGTSHGAETMKPFVAKVATDGQGFLPMLKKFRESLVDAEKGINDAMTNYRNMDHGGAGRFT